MERLLIAASPSCRNVTESMRGCRPWAPVHQICRNDTKRLKVADRLTEGTANNRLRAYIEPHNATKPTLSIYS
jgi:hypothetical protein